jgi:lipopolysaccharide transport system ATP-binding protein
MSEIVIRVQNLSKIYRIGEKKETHPTLSGKISSFIKSPFANFKKLRSLNKFDLSKENTDTIWALKDINFEVKKGEILGVIGRNGAGKSTLLKILSQITEPTTGRIEIYGRVASLLEVGTGFNPELTGRENVYLNGTILGMTRKEIDKKFNEIVDFSGIEKFIETPVKRYSSGMRMRLAFAVAAFLEPEILLIDEVLAVGDIEFQKKCLGKMNDVAKGGRTVLFVSHNIASVQKLCNKAILLKNGKLINQGNTSEVIKNYLQFNKTKKEKDLIDFKNRKGNGLVSLRKIEFINGNNKITNNLYAGEKTFIRLYLNKCNINICDLNIDIGFNDNLNSRVAWISTSVQNNSLSKSSVFKYDKNIIEFEIHKLQLMPKIYNLNILIKYKNDITDWLTGVYEFEIHDTDYYKSGKIIPQGQGCFFMDYTVKLI